MDVSKLFNFIRDSVTPVKNVKLESVDKSETDKPRVHLREVKKLNEVKKKKPFKSVKNVKLIDKTKSKREWEFKNSVMQCQNCGEVIEGIIKKCPSCGEKKLKKLSYSKKKTKKKEIKEQEKGTLTIVAKGIVDKRDAERLAREKRGSVVTDDEDEKKFMVIIKESVNEQADLENYTANVKVSLRIKGAGVKDIDYTLMTETVPLTYRLEIEHRGWGIQDISISFTESVELMWKEHTGKREGSEQTVKVDLMNAEIYWEKGNVYSPSLLDVEVDEGGKVAMADVYFDYIDKG